MLPKMPPRSGQVGFLFVPPFRVQGISVAGEQTVIQIPELDVCFDMGECPRSALPAKFVAISHGHMDHIGGAPAVILGAQLSAVSFYERRGYEVVARVPDFYDVGDDRVIFARTFERV